MEDLIDKLISLINIYILLHSVMRFFFFFSWWVDVVVALVMSVSRSFVFEVLFVIVCEHVLMSRRF